jgi:hyperosmotically inducible periplasmic protein
MKMKPALLVTALVAAAAVTVGCEQRGANDTVGKGMDQTPGKMQAQQNPQGGPAGQSGDSGQSSDSSKMGTLTPPVGQPDKSADTGSQTADKMAAQTSQAADKLAGKADDAAITAKVKAAILAEPGLKSLQISVDTKDATVILSGNVATDTLRDRAKQIAMSTEGVRNVVDNLSVKSS